MFLIKFKADAGGDQVEVTLQLDTEPRTVELPESLKTLLEQNKQALQAFEKLPPSGKRKVVAMIESSKSESTRPRQGSGKCFRVWKMGRRYEAANCAHQSGR